MAPNLANPVYYPQTVTLLSVSAPGLMSCIGYPQVIFWLTEPGSTPRWVGTTVF
jgi:hypothetical protein